MSALRMLERRPHAEGEIRTKLARKGYLAAAIDAAVARLKDAGLLDDEAFARSFVRAQLSRKPEGRRLLAARLVAHGVDRALAEETARAALSSDEEATLALAAARKFLGRRPFRFQRRPGPEEARERARLVGWLLRRGFDAEAARKAVAAAGAADDDD